MRWLPREANLGHRKLAREQQGVAAALGMVAGATQALELVPA